MMWRKNDSGICVTCQFCGKTRKGNLKCLNGAVVVKAYLSKKGCHASAEKGQCLIGVGL